METSVPIRSTSGQVLQSRASAASFIALLGSTLGMLSLEVSLLAVAPRLQALPLPAMLLAPWLGCPRSPPLVTLQLG